MKLGSSNILGISVSAINMETALHQIALWIGHQDREYICVANVHTITESRRDPLLREINNSAGMVTPDGMPLVWVSRYMGQRQVSRVYGPDLLLAVCKQSVETGWKHYFYGGGENVARQLAEKLRDQYPGLHIVGFESPPYRPLTEEEDQLAVDRINRADAEIVWVGLGAPKQEYWMADHRGRINAPVMIGVGAAFDFHAGVKKQAPRWMQRSGLEWLYRLASEPRRLWKRYLVNNPMFVWLVLLQLTGLKRFPLE